jgi:hypothetical protein
MAETPNRKTREISELLASREHNPIEGHGAHSNRLRGRRPDVDRNLDKGRDGHRPYPLSLAHQVDFPCPPGRRTPSGRRAAGCVSSLARRAYPTQWPASSVAAKNYSSVLCEKLTPWIPAALFPLKPPRRAQAEDRGRTSTCPGSEQWQL